MFVTALGIIQVMKDVFNMPFELALIIVCFHELVYCCLHRLLGDPLVPGWITPALPLVIAFLMKFSFGVERIQALIALHVLLGILYVILGSTGLAKKLIQITSKEIQLGILLGTGVSARIGTYIITFGNTILGQTVLEDANKNFRRDEKVAAHPNRLNTIGFSAFRPEKKKTGTVSVVMPESSAKT